MVQTSPEQALRDAEQMFRASDIPESFRFFERLSPLNQRLFTIELWDALARVGTIGDEASRAALVSLVEAWEATADLDAAPEVVRLIRQPKRYRSAL